ncbi:MAG: F0F1 ATP synthase subunit delta [Gammaproteobacteria bacterium]|nr:F0F1 ATP synthase subunit delta [Gammaproteobacteria bacterium]
MAEKLTVARPYAQAIFSLAQEQDQIDQWSQMLELLEEILSGKEILRLHDDPRVDDHQILEIIASVAGDGLNPMGKRMVETLIERDRLGLVPEIRALFEVERDAVQGRVEAEVISAVPLSAGQKETFENALKRRLQREIHLNCLVDETIIGGAIVRAGDMVIDGSVAGQLEKLATRLSH